MNWLIQCAWKNNSFDAYTVSGCRKKLPRAKYSFIGGRRVPEELRTFELRLEGCLPARVFQFGENFVYVFNIHDQVKVKERKISCLTVIDCCCSWRTSSIIFSVEAGILELPICEENSFGVGDMAVWRMWNLILKAKRKQMVRIFECDLLVRHLVFTFERLVLKTTETTAI